MSLRVDFGSSENAQEHLRKASKDLRKATDSMKGVVRSAKRDHPDRRRWRRLGIFGAAFGAVAALALAARKKLAGDDVEVSTPPPTAGEPLGQPSRSEDSAQAHTTSV